MSTLIGSASKMPSGKNWESQRWSGSSASMEPVNSSHGQLDTPKNRVTKFDGVVTSWPASSQLVTRLFWLVNACCCCI